MTFVDKFHDLVNKIPRKIVRTTKLLKTVEESSKEKKLNLQKNREKFLQKFKENQLKNEAATSIELIENENKQLENLSDYKLKIIEEIKYIVEHSFINGLEPIIQEGKKVCTNNKNDPFGNTEKNISNDDASSIINNKKMEDNESNSAQGSFLKKKQKRNKTLKGNKNNNGIPPEYPDENTQNLQSGEKQKVYCKCKKPSFGDMIECENPRCPNGQWFHYSCVDISEGKEPTSEWYCCPKCKEEAKNLKKKKRKKNS